MNTTKDVIKTMLTENTGSHFLDSGGLYGRHHERNQGRDFESEPQTTIEIDSSGDVSVTHSLYHFLCEHLDYDAGANHALKVLSRWKKIYGLELANEFPEFYAKYLVRQHWESEDCEECDGEGTQEHQRPGTQQDAMDWANEEDLEIVGAVQCEAGVWDIEVTCPDCGGHGRTRRPAFEDIELQDNQEPRGIYGEGEPMTVNTYNGEDLLSQTIQYVYFTIDAGEFVVLQVHGGCDVRGGYTDPVVFLANGNTELGILDNAKAGLGCGCRGRYEDGDSWSTDDGCHWYYHGSCGGSYTSKQLEKLDVVWVLATDTMERDEDREEVSLVEFKRRIEVFKSQISTEKVEPWPLKRYVLETIDGERSLLCRHCGEAMTAGFY